MAIDRVSEPSVSTSAVRDREGDRGVLVAGGRVDGERRGVGDRVDGDREVRVRGRDRAVGPLGRGGGDGEREVDVAVAAAAVMRERGEVPAGDRGGRVAGGGGEAVDPVGEVAPTGIAETVTASVSEPSVSTSAVAIESAIAVSSLPAAGLTVRVGASATASTVTARFAVVVAAAPFAPSVAVAVTVSVKSTSLCSGGRIVSAARFQPVIAAVVLPAVAVKLLTPYGERGADRDRRDGERQGLGAVGVDERGARSRARSRCPRSPRPG